MKLQFGTKPWPHQVRALKFVVRRRSALVQVPMRWGKSWVGIHWACALHELEGVQRILVITITSGLGVWEDEIAKHCPLPYRVVDFHGQLRDQKGDPQIIFMIVNYQNLYTRTHTGYGRQWVVTENTVLRKFNPEALIADEVHHLGDPTAEQSKHANVLARRAKRKLGLTGTAFHRKPFFVFGQVKFIDGGATFGTAWGHYKKRIAVFGGFGNFEVKRYKNLRWMMNKVRPLAYIEKSVPKRPPIKNTLYFELTGKHADAYNEMDEHNVLYVEDEVLTNEIVLTRHLRLLMIAGGHVKLPSGRYARVGTCKLEMFRDRITEYWEQGLKKAVVGCRFLPELAGTAKIAKAVGFQVVLFHGGVPKGDERKRRISFFQGTKRPTLFISQIATGKESIDLSSADTTLWYSLPDSYVEYDQFDKRKEVFDEKRPLMNDYLLAQGTEDLVAYESMQLKQDVAEFIVDDPERVEELTRKR